MNSIRGMSKIECRGNRFDPCWNEFGYLEFRGILFGKIFNSIRGELYGLTIFSSIYSSE